MHRSPSLVLFLSVIGIIAGISACRSTKRAGPQVLIAPSPVTLAAGSAPTTFTITVNPSLSSDVLTATLTLGSNISACTSATCGSLGSISAGVITKGVGTYTLVYTPPPSVASMQAVILDVTDTTDHNGTGQGAVTITIPLPVVSVSPPAPNINAGAAASTFTISVTNDSAADSVVPTLSPIGGGACTTATCGSLGAIAKGGITNGTGVYTVQYTPPASVASSTKVTLTATSSLTTLPGTSAITVAPAGAPIVGITPPTLIVIAGTSAPPAFAISVSNDSAGDVLTAALSVSGAACLPAVCGSVGLVTGTSGSGTYAVSYTNPATATTATAVTLTVTSSLTGSLAGISTITVNPPSVVGILPKTPALIAGGVAQTFQISVTYDSNSDVLSPVLTISGGTCSSTTHNCGTLAGVVRGAITNGTGAYTLAYTPPATVASSSVVTLTVSSTQPLSTPGTATITLAPPPVITLSPLARTVTAGTPASTFNVSVTNDTSAGSLTATLFQGGTACGMICGSAGVVTGTAGGGSYTVTYTPTFTATAPYTVTLTVSSDVPTSTPGSAVITVNPPSALTLSPPASLVAPGSAQITFQLSVPYDVVGGDTLTPVLTSSGGACSSVTHNCGTLTAISSGVITNGTGAYTLGYTPPAMIGATTIFTLTVSSSIASSSPGVATITVGAPPGVFPRYLFEVIGDATISSYVAVPSTGQLRSVNYLSVSNSFAGISSAAMNPSGKALYAAQPASIAQQFTTYSVSSGGALTQLASSVAAPGAIYGQLLPDPLGRFLWVVDTGHAQILSYSLDLVTGAPGTKTVAVNLASVDRIAADSTGNYLVARDISGNLSAFFVTTSGTLTPIGTSPASHPFGAGSIVASPSGNYIYALDGSSINSIYAYTISGAGLTSISGFPITVPNNGGTDSELAIDPSSSLLYAVDTSSPTLPIDAFTIGAGGALTTVTETMQVPQFANASHITIDPSGQFAYVTYDTARELWTYSIAPAGPNHGKLTVVNKVRTRSGGVTAQLISSGSAAVTFTPQALYVTNSTSNNISQFSIAPATGALTKLANPLGVGNAPQGIAVLPNGSFAYVADFGAHQVEPFNISNGLLGSSGQPVTSGAGPSWLTADLSGSFLYNVNQTDANIWKFAITSGVLSGGLSQASTGVAPVFVTTEPTGQFIYTANSGAGTIGQYAIHLPLGGLTSIASDINSEGAGTAWIATDPSGRFAYAANKNTPAGGGLLGEFSITAFSGSLVLSGAQPFLTVGNGATSAVVEPSGKYIFVTDFVSNKIYSFTIDSLTGQLSVNPIAVPAASTGTGPVALAVDISGQYLYCVNSGSSDINIYKINSDGTLTAVGSTTVSTGGTSPTGIAITGTLQ